MTESEWSRFADAVIKLKMTRGASGLSLYDEFSQIHVERVDQAHIGAYFLPWHRQMIWEFESALNKVSPGVSIPYWDWTAVNTNWKSDSKMWDRAGYSQELQPILSGRFKGWTSSVWAPKSGSRWFPKPSSGSRVHPVLRRFATNTAVKKEHLFESRANLDELLRRPTPFNWPSAADYIEGIHNTPHNGIGGDMGDFFLGADDPIFYIHHGFVDKIWRDWQLNGGGNAFGGTHGPRKREVPAVATEVMLPWGRTVADILGGISGCVRYQEASTRPTMARSTRMSSTARDMMAVSRQANASNEKIGQTDVEELHYVVAEKKIANPEKYRGKAIQAEAVQTSIRLASMAAGLPSRMLERNADTFRKLALLRGVDVKDAPVVRNASAEVIATQGKIEMAAIIKGEDVTDRAKIGKEAKERVTTASTGSEGTSAVTTGSSSATVSASAAVTTTDTATEASTAMGGRSTGVTMGAVSGSADASAPSN
jgi:tyrosinase